MDERQVQCALSDICAYLENGTSFENALAEVSADTGLKRNVLAARFRKSQGSPEEYLWRVAKRSNGSQISTLIDEFTRQISNRMANTKVEFQHDFAERVFAAEYSAIEADLSRLVRRMADRRLPVDWQTRVQGRFRIRRWQSAVRDAASGMVKGSWFA